MKPKDELDQYFANIVIGVVLFESAEIMSKVVRIRNSKQVAELYTVVTEDTYGTVPNSVVLEALEQMASVLKEVETTSKTLYEKLLVQKETLDKMKEPVAENAG